MTTTLDAEKTLWTDLQPGDVITYTYSSVDTVEWTFLGLGGRWKPNPAQTLAKIRTMDGTTDNIPVYADRPIVVALRSARTITITRPAPEPATLDATAILWTDLHGGDTLHLAWRDGSTGTWEFHGVVGDYPLAPNHILVKVAIDGRAPEDIAVRADISIAKGVIAETVTITRPAPEEPVTETATAPTVDDYTAAHTAHMEQHAKRAARIRDLIAQARASLEQAQHTLYEITGDDWGGDGELSTADRDDAVAHFNAVAPPLRGIDRIAALFQRDAEDYARK